MKFQFNYRAFRAWECFAAVSAIATSVLIVRGYPTAALALTWLAGGLFCAAVDRRARNTQ